MAVANRKENLHQYQLKIKYIFVPVLNLKFTSFEFLNNYVFVCGGLQTMQERCYLVTYKRPDIVIYF